MTQYAFIENNEVVKIGQLPSQYKGRWTKNLTLEELSNLGVLPFVMEEYPAIDSTVQKYSSINYSIGADSVTGSFTAVDKTQDDLDADFQNSLASLRETRDRLLKESDDLMFEDSPLTAEQMITHKTYRQELRDLPNSLGDTHPRDASFPIKPDHMG
jgi:hypothetical protein